MVTASDTTGATSRGNIEQLWHGYTLWGTLLTCEENWAAYFHMPKGSNAVDAKLAASLKRYGVASAPLACRHRWHGPGWHTVSATDNRFNC